MSVIFISGITGSDKNDKVKNGLKFNDGAILSMAACNFAKSSITSWAFLLVIRPAISNFNEALHPLDYPNDNEDHKKPSAMMICTQNPGHISEFSPQLRALFII